MVSSDGRRPCRWLQVPLQPLQQLARRASAILRSPRPVGGADFCATRGRSWSAPLLSSVRARPAESPVQLPGSGTGYQVARKLLFLTARWCNISQEAIFSMELFKMLQHGQGMRDLKVMFMNVGSIPQHNKQQ